MPKKITKDAISGGTDMLFAGMTPKAEQPANEEKNLKKKTARTKKTPAEPDKKKGKAYTLWMDPDTIELLDVYCKISKEKKKDVIRAAISEYTRRHKLTEEQKAAYQGRTDVLC